METGPEDRSYWRKRATDTRALAAKTRDRPTREDLLAIADTCERLAELAEGTRETKAAKPPALEMAG
jgi:hypothetical protein